MTVPVFIIDISASPNILKESVTRFIHRRWIATSGVGSLSSSAINIVTISPILVDIKKEDYDEKVIKESVNIKSKLFIENYKNNIDNLKSLGLNMSTYVNMAIKQNIIIEDEGW